jgi:asparagine synthase (glutamine-hydrolysing)
MCGIAGYVNLKADLSQSRSVEKDGLVRALERMRFRGPDGADTWSDERCALGHRRLAIIDLSDGGRQPMARHGRIITFNGEIYNHEALRLELEALGHVFQSRSDTEVLLAGWRQWGADLLPRLSGMFAFALWDAQAGELVLARDRFGKKPLVYACRGTQLAFASDLAALRRIVDVPAEIDQDALKLFFALRYIPEPWTILQAARKLPMGSLARFGADGLSIERWDRGARARRPVFTDRQEAIAALRQRFDAAVTERLVSDVPVGAFLSGGIDSAIVCASLAAQGHKARSFTVGFPGAAEYYEERPAAKQVARYLGLDHTEIEINPQDAERMVDDVFAACDEPFADSSALPAYLLSRETRRFVTVALSGDGSDEVFAGYRKYQGEIWVRQWQAIPVSLRNMLTAALQAMPENKDNALLEWVRRMRRFAAHAGKDLVARQAGWAETLDEQELGALLLQWRPKPDVQGLFAPLLEEAEGDPVNRMLYAEQGIVLNGDMLRKVDMMSMANSLEVRCPFLDRELTDIAAAIPGSWKLEQGRGKAILRDAFADRLPADVFRRPKKGFEMPIANWLGTSLRERLRAASDPQRLRRQGLLNPDEVQRWIQQLDSGRRDTSAALWSLLAFQSWMDGEGNIA